MPRQLAPITLPTFPEKVPLAPLINFAIFSNDLKSYYFNLYALPVFRCTGTLTDRGKHRSLNTSILALSPTCHRIRGMLSPIRPFGDTVVTCSRAVARTLCVTDAPAAYQTAVFLLPRGCVQQADSTAKTGGQPSHPQQSGSGYGAVVQPLGVFAPLPEVTGLEVFPAVADLAVVVEHETEFTVDPVAGHRTGVYQQEIGGFFTVG